VTRMAAVQMVSGADVEKNLAHAATLVAAAAAAGARLVALPENFAVMPRAESERRAAAEADGRGPIQEFLARAARTHRVWLVGGTVALTAGAPGKLRASCLLFNDAGERVARYDKIHLFDASPDGAERYQESAGFEAGAEVVVADTPFGRLGLAVCYDLRFPELFRRLLDRGAEIFAVPSAFTAYTGGAHWETLVRARAIENLAFVIAPDQGGRHENGRETHGDSMIVGPWGEVLARCGKGAGVAIADCDPEQLRKARTRLPSIQHRRIKSG